MKEHTRRIFFYIALTGFALAVIIHTTALSGYPLSMDTPLMPLLHIGIFVVFIPAVIDSGYRRRAWQMEQRKAGKPLKKAPGEIIFEHTPQWLYVIVRLLTFYVVINFVLFAKNTGGGGPHIYNDQYAIVNHGELIRYVDKSEYISLKANEVRGFSGHWLLFYLAAAAMLCPKRDTPKILKVKNKTERLPSKHHLLK